MAKQNLVFLGQYNGVSKTNGNPYSLAHFYGEQDGVRGFRSFQFFLQDDETKNVVSSMAPLTKCVADVRYINKQNVLISILKA